MAVKTMINSPTYGRFIFDAVFDTSHSANLMVTEHPVQSGASIADHAFMEPDEVQLQVGMTDVATGMGMDGASRSVNAYSRLRAIMAAREPVTLITRLRTYQNMLIVSLSAPDDYTTMNALRASVSFKQINVVSVSTVTVQQTVSASVRSSQSGSGSGSGSNATQKSSSSNKTSLLKQAADSLNSSSKTATKVTTTKVATKPSSAMLKNAQNIMLK